MDNLKVIGHRGARGLLAENSLASFRAAANSRADAIEFDIQATKDGQLVVCHTMSSPRKVFGITQPLGTLDWDDIKKYKNNDGERMPTFTEVMAVLKNKRVMIDVKDIASSKILVGKLRNVNTEQIALINSFYPEALSEIKSAYPDIALTLHTYTHPFKAISLAKKNGFYGVALVLYLLNPVTYWAARQAGLRVSTYQNYASFLLTWRWLTRLLWLIYPGVIVITDRPDKIAGES